MASLLIQYLQSIFRHPHTSFAERPWQECVMRIGPHVLRLSVPTGESRDFFPPEPIVERVDPDDASAWRSRDWKVLLEKYWDDPQVRSSLQAGTMKLSVSMFRISPNGTEITQFEGLKDYIERRTIEKNAEFRREGFALEDPQHYDQIILNGRPWLAFSISDVSSYVVALGLTSYLRLNFNRVSMGPRPQWAADVNALRDTVLSRLVLESAP